MANRRLAVLTASLALLLHAAVGAEESGQVDAQPAPDSAPVSVDGVELFHVSGSASFPSAERARNVTARIEAAADDVSIPLSAVVTQPREGRIDIVAGNRHLVAVVASDAALEGVSLTDAALVRSMRIREALTRYRADRSPERIAEAVFTATIAAAIAALLLLGAMRGFRYAFDMLERRYHSRVTSLTIQSFEVVRAESIWRGLKNVLGALRILLIGAIVYALSAFVLRQFPWTRGIGGHLVQLVVDPLQSMGTALLSYVPKLAFLVVLVILIRYLLKLIGLFFDAVGAGRVPLRSFDAEWAQPTYQIVRILTVLLALVIAYPYLPGSGSAAFQGLSIFAGLMLSLGASSAMASLIAGYTVTYRRAFRVGDRITVGEFTGEVTEVRLMVTHLRTPKNEEVIVPNSVVLQSHVVNYSKLAKTRGLILHTTVSIGYETPWRQVEGMLLLAAQRTSALLHEPQPFVLEKSLDDFAVTYELNVCVDSATALPERYAAMHRNILDVFNEYGVQIMTPAYEGDPSEPKVVPQERWFPEPAART
ncbi:MAG TPA: mechanosensitive ion channel domain-containing protein [Steroidobacteraceae bacterium]